MQGLTSTESSVGCVMEKVKQMIEYSLTITIGFTILMLCTYSTRFGDFLYFSAVRSLALFLIVSSLVTIFHWICVQWNRHLYPPGPCPLPWFGNLLSINQEDPRRSFTKWRRQYGPVYTLYLPKPTVIFTDYESIDYTFGSRSPVSKVTSGRPHGFLWQIFMGGCFEGSGIILSENRTWNDNRATALSLLRDSGVGNQILENKILDEVEKLKHHWNGKLGDGVQKSAFELNPENDLSFCIGNIIERILFSKSFDFGDPNFLLFKSYIDTILEITQSFAFLLANNYRFFKDCLQVTKVYKNAGFALTDRFEHLIEEHEESFEEDNEDRDIMHGFMAKMITNYPEEKPSRLSLCITVGDLWTGGMETTFTTIRWALIYLLHYPRVMRRCQQELDKVFADGAPTYIRRAETPFFMATLAEIQRIVNVLPWSIPHRSTADFCYGDHVVPKNTDLIPVYGSVLFDDNVFICPESFKPERFLNVDGTFKNVKELIPFGVGPRKCPGETMARTELYLVFASLLKHYDFHPLPSKPLPSLRRNRGITTKPCDYELIIQRRNSLR